MALAWWDLPVVHVELTIDGPPATKCLVAGLASLEKSLARHPTP